MAQPVDRALPDEPDPTRRGRGPANDADRQVRRASVVAGIGLVAMGALAGFGNFVGVEGLITPGDATATAREITGSEGVFRAAIVSLLLVVVLDVVVAWALFHVFSPVSTGVSRLAAWLRLVYAGIFAVAISQLVGVVRLLDGDGHLTAWSTEQLRAQALSSVAAFTDLWSAGLLLFGVHLLVLGYLAHRSGYVPKLLGALVALAGVGYVFDSVAAILSPELGIQLAAFTFLGEILLALWLLARGSRLTVSEPI